MSDDSSGFFSGFGLKFLDKVFDFGTNWFNTEHNSNLALKNQLKVMEKSDEYQRKYLQDQFGLTRTGLEQAGYNPLLAFNNSGSSEALSVGSGSGTGQTALSGTGFSDLISTAKQIQMFKESLRGQKLANDKIEQDIKNSKKLTNAQSSQLLQSARQIGQSININSPKERLYNTVDNMVNRKKKDKDLGFNFSWDNKKDFFSNVKNFFGY